MSTEIMNKHKVNEMGKSTKVVEKIGHAIHESAKTSPRMKVRERYAPFLEKMKQYSEVINSTGTDADLFSTTTAAIIDQAFEPMLLARGIIKTIQLDMSGSDSLKVPKEAGQLTAVTVNDDGTFPSEATTGYESTTITINWVGAYTAIPEQLIKKAAVDLIAHRLGQIGRAIARKVDSDIITEFDACTTAGDSFYGTNSNYYHLGTGAGSLLSYSALVTGIANHRALDANPTDILLTPANWGVLMSDTSMKAALAFGTTTNGQIPAFQEFANLRIHYSSQLPANHTFLVDRETVGYFIDASDVQVFDGRVDNTIQNEILGVKAYGVRISRPKSVYAIRNQTA